MLLCMEETWQHVSVHSKQGKWKVWANCLMKWRLFSSRGLRISETTFFTQGGDQRANHSAMNHRKQSNSSWMVSHIDHISDSIQGCNDSLLDCLYLAWAYRYPFVWRRNKNTRMHAYVHIYIYMFVKETLEMLTVQLYTGNSIDFRPTNNRYS